MVDLSKYTKENIGKLFDYSVLPKDTMEDGIRKGCKEAIAYNCAAFYTSSPFWLPVVVEELKGTDVLPACGVNFPFGTATPAIKAFEAEEAVKRGAKAVDSILNVMALKSGYLDVVKEEMTSFKKAVGDGVITKYILDVEFLTDEEIATACKLVAEAGIDYAKAATGQFNGPSMEQFLVMKETLKDTDVKLKVAGVKFPRPQNAYAFIMAGADLIGTRAAPAIIDALDQMREIGIVPAYKG